MRDLIHFNEIFEKKLAYDDDWKTKIYTLLRQYIFKIYT